jgi:tRNA A-37 threonylcarbamoyl transferase component Bud32
VVAVLSKLRRRNSSIYSGTRTIPAADAAEGVGILHSVGIIGDINSWNFLIDDDSRLCIIDFSGSTIDGKAGSAF